MAAAETVTHQRIHLWRARQITPVDARVCALICARYRDFFSIPKALGVAHEPAQLPPRIPSKWRRPSCIGEADTVEKLEALLPWNTDLEPAPKKS
ncbi:MAG: hypothetical protein FKY71_16345 [Spiribacter salinus]|uniref:Uncharacterized protein n=1 Tax=Spiribacter salinus TaxID=1335746 RepID=A0A540VJF3_9GAMM|nr:MAG: hypothetical protein FKY71_16345 [Spiribacter salinus]